MADNVVANSGSGGSTFATDDIASVHYPRTKLSLGADGSATDALGGAGAVAAGVIRATLASDDPAVTSLQLIDDAVYTDGTGTPSKAVGVAGTDGTNPQILKTDTSGELQVDVLTLPALSAGTNNIGDVDVLTLPALVAGTANIGDVDVLTLPALPAGTNNIGDVDVLTLPNVTLAAGTNTNEVVGDVAHDAAAAGNPVLVAGRANANEPATAVADGDATYLWTDTWGRLVTLPGHPSPEAPATANGSAAGLSVIAAPGASLSLYICKVTITNRAAAENVVSLREGAAGTIRTTINCASDGGGANLDYGPRGWKLPANTALVADIAAASVDVNVTEYYIGA